MKRPRATCQRCGRPDTPLRLDGMPCLHFPRGGGAWCDGEPVPPHPLAILSALRREVVAAAVRAHEDGGADAQLALDVALSAYIREATRPADPQTPGQPDRVTDGRTLQ